MLSHPKFMLGEVVLVADDPQPLSITAIYTGTNEETDEDTWLYDLSRGDGLYEGVLESQLQSDESADAMGGGNQAACEEDC